MSEQLSAATHDDEPDAPPSKTPARCVWAYSAGDAMLAYHDEEWGKPCHDSRDLFERLCLEGLQAGLSWSTILNKRERLRTVFHEFEPERVAAMDDEVPALMADPGIIRNRRKIEAIIHNAQLVGTMDAVGESFDSYLWSFVDGKVRVNRPADASAIPPSDPTSTAMSKAMKTRGFKFVGPTIMYAFMQSVGMVNDHVQGCFLCPQNG
ncbi:DNA-3-methyladenine glycosylase I [Bifidobacterium tibiigranuli]|jgi:DNA-3-methyladenine glycosylase I|nr:DNA-3-methyladenine glycosylase I [Bifidobacterium tibiigranuli]MCH3975140.1 DNA-3-methyladenine glycosylase I [Bifidobacterium tibiigranuli]MCH4190211.1 DNA-3-methyladenine glycosylase I [Bifidobacterium tibiigranuli]MCH4202898.1 DNA-3-methyladenine glycosylase I [Bifidobacterium tibiigranuli]MCH4274850.1 DNA-3-methyladenine glycosylase I [Bifidobacterium tibiigranuli]MCI1210939.1 DNA-3-methyladenine glycosylase I [Bifidobacterium tibiigranuli]